MAVDQYELHAQQMREQAAANERARAENVSTFTKLWLGLGVDIVKIAGTSSHDAELAEAKGLAARRWDVLLNQEAQIVGDEQALASRPKKRPSLPTDEMLPDRTLAARDLAWENETKGLREELAALKEITKTERRELESWRVDFRRK